MNGEATGEAPFSESDPAAPADAYAVSKWEAATALFGIAPQGALEAAALRPPLLHRPPVGGHVPASGPILRGLIPGIRLRKTAFARPRRGLLDSLG